MNAKAEQIRSRCYWEVIVRPSEFVERRFENRHALDRIVRGAAVTYQGFQFPHVAGGTGVESGPDWVGRSLDMREYLELWRGYLSGQFYLLSANHSDWGYRPMLSPFERLDDDEPFVGLGYALFRFTLAIEFAARLAFTEMGDDRMHVEITVGNLRRHRLVIDDPNRSHLQSQPTAGLDVAPYSRDLSRAELAASPRNLALEAAAKFFKSFDAQLSEDLLKDLQKQWLMR